MLLIYRSFIAVLISLLVGDVFALGDERRIDRIPQLESAEATANKKSEDLSKILGWVRDCKSNLPCGGYYFEPSEIVKCPAPNAVGDNGVKINASKPAFFSYSGESLLEGDVVLSQPGRQVLADRIDFIRDNKSGKIKSAILSGNIAFREYGKLLIANQGELDFINKKYYLKQGWYRFLNNVSTGLVNVWGRAKRAFSEHDGVLEFEQATYSSCPPDATSWYLWSNRLKLDNNRSRGEAINSVLLVKKIPVFYLPYFSFALDKKRKSGFLAPNPSYSSDSGYGFDLPYYFNLAPNYDATITPEIFTKRGVLFKGDFRYLTPNSSGEVRAEYMPKDRAFINFRDAKRTDISDQYALRLLQQSSDYRGSFSFKHSSVFDSHWSGFLDANYVTDDYFEQNFGGYRSVAKDQLLNRADINYLGEHWSFLGRLQMFQTLHPITSARTIDQYQRLPQLDIAGDFPEVWSGINYRLAGEVVNFSHRHDSEEDSKAIVDGARLLFYHAVSKSIDWRGIVSVPKLEIAGVGYSIYNRGNKLAENSPSSLGRLYPAFSLDNNLVLTRNTTILGSQYRQTFEPRIFYLWVIKQNQDDLPIFDTYLPAFDFEQMFRTNRFSGIDRMGDANHLVLAATTRFLDQEGGERFNASIGQMVSFHKHQVLVENNASTIVPFNPDPLKSEVLSPLVGRMQYFVSNRINGSLNLAWDPNYRRMNTTNFNLQYVADNDRVLNLWYQYALKGDQVLQGKPINLSRIGLSFGWKVWQNWKLLGNLNYNTGYSRAQNYLYGVEYNSCCWGGRIFHSRNFIGIGSDNSNNYDSRYYLQVVFKGFSDVDFGNTSSILTEKITGFKDRFSAR